MPVVRKERRPGAGGPRDGAVHSLLSASLSPQPHPATSTFRVSSAPLSGRGGDPISPSDPGAVTLTLYVQASPECP